MFFVVVHEHTQIKFFVHASGLLGRIQVTYQRESEPSKQKDRIAKKK